MMMMFDVDDDGGCWRRNCGVEVVVGDGRDRVVTAHADACVIGDAVCVQSPALHHHTL